MVKWIFVATNISFWKRFTDIHHVISTFEKQTRVLKAVLAYFTLVQKIHRNQFRRLGGSWKPLAGIFFLLPRYCEHILHTYSNLEPTKMRRNRNRARVSGEFMGEGNFPPNREGGEMAFQSEFLDVTRNQKKGLTI